MTQQQESFIKFYSVVLKCKNVHFNSEILVPLSTNDKMIWMYTLAKYSSFKENKMQYFETQEQISDALGLCTRTVNSSLKKLKHLQIICVQKTKAEGLHFKNIYTEVKHPSEVLSKTQRSTPEHASFAQ